MEAVEVPSGMIRLSDLELRNMIFGRPGTGKTTTIGKIMENYIMDGNDPSSVIYVTYSRAMAREARKKLGMDKKHAGTLHSLLSMRLGWRVSKTKGEGDYLTDEEATEFASKHRIEKKMRMRASEEPNANDDEDEYSKLMLAYDRSKNEVPEKKASVYYDNHRFDVDYMVGLYEKYKSDIGKKDYTDILLEASRVGENILENVGLLLVDEAQDLSPIMWKIIETWATKSNLFIIAGDEMQSIYGFRGARASLFLEKRENSKLFHLNAGFRLPKQIKDIADNISSRVKEKEEINFSATEEEGSVKYISEVDSFLECEGSKWILCTTKWIISQACHQLRKRKEIYMSINPRHANISPWSWKMIKLLNILSSWPAVEPDDLIILLKELPAKGILQHGIKTMADKNDVKGIASLMKPDLINENALGRIFIDPDIKSGEIMKCLKLKDKAKELLSEYVGIIVKNEDIIRIDTYHSSKGLEADNVAVVLDMTKKIYESHISDPDASYRTLYVAVTRARKNLFLWNMNLTELAYHV